MKNPAAAAGSGPHAVRPLAPAGPGPALAIGLRRSDLLSQSDYKITGGLFRIGPSPAAALGATTSCLLRRAGGTDSSRREAASASAEQADNDERFDDLAGEPRLGRSSLMNVVLPELAANSGYATSLEVVEARLPKRWEALG